MEKEKGQIQISLFVLVIIGAVILFSVFIKPSQNKTTKPNTSPTVSSPASPKEEKVYSPPSQVADKNPPYRSNPQPTGQLPASTRIITISLDTDENAFCRYSETSGVFYEYMQHSFSNTGGTFHTALITTLNEGMFYNFFIRCVDEQGNKNTDDFVIGFYVSQPADYTPPVISNAYPKGDTLSYGTVQTMIGVSTNEPASCRYSFLQGTSYNSMTNNLSPDETQKYHTAVISNLRSGQAYEYFVRCKDAVGNANTGDVMINFQVAY